MGKDIEKAFETICRAIVDSSCIDCHDYEFFAGLCVEEGVTADDVELLLYESFGMGAGEIMAVLRDC